MHGGDGYLIRGNLVKGVDRDKKYCVLVKQGEEC